MGIIDIILMVILLWSAVQGFRKGLIIQASKLVALAIGIFGAMMLYEPCAALMSEHTTISEGSTKIVVFGLLFIVIIVLVNLVSRLITRVVEAVALGLLNRLLGVIFSIVLAALSLSIVMFLINFIDSSIHFIPDSIREGSILLPPIENFAPNIFESLGITLHETNVDILDSI